MRYNIYLRFVQGNYYPLNNGRFDTQLLEHLFYLTGSCAGCGEVAALDFV
jgi:hypothetical protein